jgi:hypothetical protein
VENRLTLLGSRMSSSGSAYLLSDAVYTMICADRRKDVSQMRESEQQVSSKVNNAGRGEELRRSSCRLCYLVVFGHPAHEFVATCHRDMCTHSR